MIGCPTVEQIDASPFRGSRCSFVKVDDNWGIKAYSHEDERDDVYDTQVKYSELDFAPPVGDKFQIGDYFCYATRVAEILIEPGQYMSDEWEEKEKEYEELIEEKLSLMEEADLHPMDTHLENWGFYEKELVLIDLGMD